jgi:hypothetical protein
MNQGEFEKLWRNQMARFIPNNDGRGGARPGAGRMPGKANNYSELGARQARLQGKLPATSSLV